MTRRDFLKSSAIGTAGFAMLGGLAVSNSLTAAQKQLPNMSNLQLPFREIHLDFHTSEDIPGIGADFDPDYFADTLQNASVNSVTCFGRCHHGWIYHETKQFPELVHPYLEYENLLGDQIEACHKRNIRVPIYVTVQWDYHTSRRKPEWVQLSPEGEWRGTQPYEDGFYTRMCMNSPYREFLKKYLNDLFEAVPVDGLFLDITGTQDCSCKYCRADMEAEGLNPANQEQREEFGFRVFQDFYRDISTYIRKLDRNASIFYNAGHIGPHQRVVADYYTHFELESLPSGGWGYLHFPLSVRYARNLGKDTMGMTGKFHTSWGDFHSFKRQESLQFECFNMLAMNAKCSIGDQLHPGGKIDEYTYDLIGSVYSEVEKKEPWCQGAEALVDIGVMNPEEFMEFGGSSRIPQPAAGAVRMLQEGRHQFDMIDSESDFSRYKVIILPDTIPVEGDLLSKLEQFLADGGSIIASFESGLDAGKNEFILDALGVSKASDGPVDSNGNLARGRPYGRNNYAEYLIPNNDIGRGLNPTEHVMYMHGMVVDAGSGSEVLAYNTESYFDRTWEHFCSHRQTPSSGEQGKPAIVRNGSVIYFSHPIFSQYNKNAPKWYKTMFLNAMEMLLPEPVLQIEGPTTIQATVNEQSDENRYVAHLLHYIPERRGQDFDVIEDVIPVYDISVSLNLPNRVKSAKLVPAGEAIDMQRRSGRVEFTLSELRGHQMIELTY
jgi:hypothetical protein